MIRIEVINEFNEEDFTPLFKRIARAVSIDQLVLRKRALNIMITNNETIHDYNKRFRNVDRPTDVLSFPSDEKGELGDIMISYEKALEQSIEYGHSLEREMGFLMLHGTLHCLGYDHIEKKDEEVMFPLQDKILNKVKLER